MRRPGPHPWADPRRPESRTPLMGRLCPSCPERREAPTGHPASCWDRGLRARGWEHFGTEARSRQEAGPRLEPAGPEAPVPLRLPRLCPAHCGLSLLLGSQHPCPTPSHSPSLCLLSSSPPQLSLPVVLRGPPRQPWGWEDWKMLIVSLSVADGPSSRQHREKRSLQHPP